MNLQADDIYDTIREIISLSRQRVYRMANTALLETYWQIGQIIVEDEQNGKAKAEYGKGTLKSLASQLTLEFGKGFAERNLNSMRTFYRAFPNWTALHHELSWTHYLKNPKPNPDKISKAMKPRKAINSAFLKVKSTRDKIEGFNYYAKEANETRRIISSCSKTPGNLKRQTRL
jgi:hypothetical protein